MSLLYTVKTLPRGHCIKKASIVALIFLMLLQSHFFFFYSPLFNYHLRFFSVFFLKFGDSLLRKKSESLQCHMF